MKKIILISAFILLGCNENKLNLKKDITHNFGIVIHGGAGTILKQNMQRIKIEGII